VVFLGTRDAIGVGSVFAREEPTVDTLQACADQELLGGIKLVAPTDPPQKAKEKRDADCEMHDPDASHDSRRPIVFPEPITIDERPADVHRPEILGLDLGVRIRLVRNGGDPPLRLQPWPRPPGYLRGWEVVVLRRDVARRKQF